MQARGLKRETSQIPGLSALLGLRERLVPLVDVNGRSVDSAMPPCMNYLKHRSHLLGDMPDSGWPGGGRELCKDIVDRIVAGRVRHSVT